MARLRFEPLALVLVCSGTAFGQTPAPAPAPAPAPSPAPAPAAAPAKAASNARSGVGPFWDAVSKGDAAYAARDFDGAVKEYRTAIEKEPNNPMGHYRLGETMLAKTNLDEAEQSFQTALRFAGKDENIRAKILFCLADLKERLKKLDEADTRWKDYASHAQAHPEARTFPASAAERQKRIAAWKQLQADSLAVKERIDKRLKETEESMRKSSK